MEEEEACKVVGAWSLDVGGEGRGGLLQITLRIIV